MPRKREKKHPRSASLAARSGVSLPAAAESIEVLESRLLLSASPILKRSIQLRPLQAAHAPANHAAKNGIKSALMQVKKTGVKSASTYAAPPASALTPAQIRGAYGIDSINFSGIAGDGTGQTIAIVDAYDDPGMVSSTDPDFLTSDLAMFDSQYGLTNPQFTKIDQRGGTSYPSADAGWSLEISLDVEWAHVIAPRASIVLVESDSASLDDVVGNPFTDTIGAVTTAANWPGVSIVSMSFGQAEFTSESDYDSIFTTPAGHNGVTFLAATGDTGSSGTFYPAYSPNVVAVGGTTLTAAGNTYSSETAWAGTGGNIASYESKPGYQSAITSVNTSPTQTIAANNRIIPDVAFDADPSTGVAIYDSTYGGTDTPWAQVGGTSFSCPAWAALIAIVNQGRALNGQTSLDGPGQTLPAIYSASSSDFHDITSGNNGGFYAVGGYDATTGLGTPIANKLVDDLAGQPQTSISNLYVKEAGTTLDLWVNSATPGQGTPTEQYALAAASCIRYTGASGNDTLTLDYSAGDFTTAFYSINLTGSTGGNNTIAFIGTTGSDVLTAASTGITPSGGFGSTPIKIANVQTIRLIGGSGGSDAVNVSGSPASGYIVDADTAVGTPNVAVNVTGSGTAISFASTQHLAALSIASSDTATLTSSSTWGGKLLVTAGLTLSGSGVLDLTNNALVVQGGDLTTITNLIASAFSRGLWNGSGIASSAAANDPQHRTVLGIISNNNAGSPIYPTFEGYNATASDILVRYTYYGDADLNGTVNGADFQKIDAGYGLGNTSKWSDGNFNYDGVVDGSDYSIIDNAFNEQLASS